MQIHRRFATLPGSARGASVAIGNFDGVHVGHRAVIGIAADAAHERGVATAVLTFEPHPREVIRPEQAPPRLTNLARKAELLASLGVQHLFVLPFDRHLMHQAPEDFAREILIGRLGISAAAAGADFCFGRKRSGNMESLTRLGREHGFEVRTVHGVALDGELASSTLIRRHLLAGDVAAANMLLGAPFTTAGIVVHGDKRGRELGYPTANIKAIGRPTLLPADGIYAVRAGLPGPEGVVWHDAVCSLGMRPSFHGQDRRLEVNILDGQFDLYGTRMRVAFVARLRGEEFFADLSALIQQMARDCEAARAALAHDAGHGASRGTSGRITAG